MEAEAVAQGLAYAGFPIAIFLFSGQIPMMRKMAKEGESTSESLTSAERSC
jgi:hypothetical protein